MLSVSEFCAEMCLPSAGLLPPFENCHAEQCGSALGLPSGAAESAFAVLVMKPHKLPGIQAHVSYDCKAPMSLHWGHSAAIALGISVD